MTHSERVREQIKSDGKLNTSETLRHMKTSIADHLTIFLCNRGAERLRKHINFDIVEIRGKTCFNPYNFFTGLLFQGVFCPASIYGLTELATTHGIYRWENNQMLFQPIEPVERI